MAEWIIHSPHSVLHTLLTVRVSIRWLTPGLTPEWVKGHRAYAALSALYVADRLQLRFQKLKDWF